MEWLANPDMWAAFLTLAALEIVLGIDNLIFISIATSGLPEAQARKARQLGLTLALIMRVALLASIFWIAQLTTPVFSIFTHDVSWRDLILLAGGLFLLVKGTQEIHGEMEGHAGGGEATRTKKRFGAVIGQIIVLDVVFSIDSIITAVGMTDQIGIMIAAVFVSIIVMMFAAGPVSRFIAQHPTVKMLALSFLLLIGMALVADALHFHIPRGYLYFAIAFSALVETLNILVKLRNGRRSRPPVGHP